MPIIQRNLRSIDMTGVLRRALLSHPLYTGDRSKRSWGKGFEESVIDESEALIQIRSISNFLEWLFSGNRG